MMTYDIIHLAPNEWGSECMRIIAEEYFAAHPAVDFVLVQEHAGWSLGFCRDGSIWSTANDAAKMPRGPKPTGGFSGREIRRRAAGGA